VDSEQLQLAEEIAALLGDRRLACAESVTAGRLATMFAGVEQALTFFRGGAVTYQREIKEALLGVTAPSVLTLAAAEQMAQGACRTFGAQVAVSTTGLAGGDPQDGVPVGTVFVGVSVDGQVTSARHHFDGDPEQICEAGTRRALLDLLDRLRESERARAGPAPVETERA
jgi:nicotinamide-nucleotide amidase